jgi:hypothetical protein
MTPSNMGDDEVLVMLMSGFAILRRAAECGINQLEVFRPKYAFTRKTLFSHSPKNWNGVNFAGFTPVSTLKYP